MRRIVKTSLLLITISSLCSCSSVRKNMNFPEVVNIRGVITRHGRTANGFTVRTKRSNRTKTRAGYYEILEVSSGPTRIYIGPRPPGSTPRYYPMAMLNQPEEVLCYDMVPYYAADHGAFDYDLRLHRSWGNALDNPFDTASGNALFENTHTLSGIVMKPVYAVAVAGEVVWTIPGSIIALGSASTCKVMNKDFGMFGFSRIMLADYLPIEAFVKAIEIPVRTVLWPIDRLVSWPSRKRLQRTREEVLQKQKDEHPNRQSS